LLKKILAKFEPFDQSNALPLLIGLLSATCPLFFTAPSLINIVCAAIATIALTVFCRQKTVYETTLLASPNFILVILTAIGLGILTWLAFYKPMLEHFWVGYDEPMLLSITTLWFSPYDVCCARPLAGLEAYLGNLLMPGNIDSLPIMQAIERWLLGVGVFLFLVSLLPEAKTFAVAAGFLTVVNPTELLRFTPGLGLPYGGAIMFFVFAIYFFISSYNLASRLLLLFACGFLGIAFLHYESILLVSTIVPFLLWSLPTKPQRGLWAAAWFATTFLFLARFAIFLVSGPAYQSSYSRRYSFSAVIEYFPLVFKPIFRFITPIYDRSLLTPLPATLGIATFIFLVFIVGCFKKGLYPQRRQMKFVGLFSLAAVALTILPGTGVANFVKKAIPNFDGDLTLRLEFIPGPFQAIVWAAAVAWGSSFLFRSQYWFAAGISVLVSCSVLNSLELQAKKGTLNTYLDFQKESDLFRAAAPIIQRSPADSTVFFVIPDDTPSPFGFGYHPFHMTCLLFGREGYAGHYSAKFGFRPRNTAFPSPIDEKENYGTLPPFKNIVILSVDNDQNVTELELEPSEMQSAILASSKAADRIHNCTTPRANARPNGDLPFLLPKS
jgi:hypothetical protein